MNFWRLGFVLSLALVIFSGGCSKDFEQAPGNAVFLKCPSEGSDITLPLGDTDNNTLAIDVVVGLGDTTTPIGHEEVTGLPLNNVAVEVRVFPAGGICAATVTDHFTGEEISAPFITQTDSTGHITVDLNCSTADVLCGNGSDNCNIQFRILNGSVSGNVEGSSECNIQNDVTLL